MGIARKAAVFACLVILAGAVASAPERSGASAARAKVNPPEPWRAYPLNQVESNLAAQAAQDACDFESRQPAHRRALLVFLVGRASRQNGKFGVGSDPNFRPNNRIYNALHEAGKAYARCRSGSKKVDIAYGVTNYKLSSEIASQRGAHDAGVALRRVADKLARRAPRGVGAAVATDIEPGWDPNGSGIAIALSHGAAETRRAAYNLGSVGRCPPFGTGCQGNWTYVDVGRVSQDKGVIPLPQIYHPRQAKTWARAANRWDLAGRNCPHANRRNCFDFGGVTSQPQECSGVFFTPRESWLRMRRATVRRVGRRIIYFNPREVGCRAGAEEPSMRTGATTAELPLMPEIVPAEVVEDPDPILSDDVLTDVTNAWRVGSHREYTWVFAGRAPGDPLASSASSTGRLVITRERYRRDRPVSPTIQTVDVPGSGALAIASAPEGARHVRTAHDGAILNLAGEGGAGWTLDLETMSVGAR